MPTHKEKMAEKEEDSKKNLAGDFNEEKQNVKFFLCWEDSSWLLTKDILLKSDDIN